MDYFTFSRYNPLVMAMLVSPLFAILAVVPLTLRAESAPVTAPQTSPVLQRSYTIKAGDRLDRIIQSTMPDSPLKIEVLRKAFIDLNPLAFPAGNASRMLKGVVLQIPDAPKLLASIAAPASQELVMNKKISGPMSGDYEERRRWVRYP
jgi:Tfp pilus assembly protein FimV